MRRGERETGAEREVEAQEKRGERERKSERERVRVRVRERHRESERERERESERERERARFGSLSQGHAGCVTHQSGARLVSIRSSQDGRLAGHQSNVVWRGLERGTEGGGMEGGGGSHAGMEGTWEEERWRGEVSAEKEEGGRRRSCEGWRRKACRKRGGEEESVR